MISNGVGDVAKYLSEAASSIFKTSDSSVPWEGSGSPFSGKSYAHLHPFLATLTAPCFRVAMASSRRTAVYSCVQDASHTMMRCPA